jgi:hypothetical protein
MQIDRRFADYGLTGGLFLVCQLSLLFALGYWPTVVKELKALQLPADNSLLAPIITGFAGALAVIAVFVTGLILDLAASFFRSVEMRMFANHLQQNRDWLSGLIEANKIYCEQDYVAFQKTQHELQTLERPRPDDFLWALMLWKRNYRRRYIKRAKLRWGWNSRPYARLWTFFLSYIAIQSGSSAQLSVMAEQYSLWRAGRAIAAAVCLFGFELVLVASSSTNELIQTYVLVPLLFTAFGWWFSNLIIKGTYARLCFTLFSLVYVTYDKQIHASNDPKVA